ncbi:MAG: hypothetical protein EB133_13475 [Betaproteobacteria bacterium]|nr:hypothetical protein [Betaproteobacteria bacterium]
MPNRQKQNEQEAENKMNAQIKELTEQLPIAKDVQKSIANRLESALTKKGSASSRLRMASQSLNALANSTSDDESGYADLFARIFEIGAQIGVDNKKQTEPKTTREQWHDADSAEGQAIIASKSPRKPRKNKSVEISGLDSNTIITQLLQALNASR